MIDYKVGFVKPKASADVEYDIEDFDIVAFGTKNKTLQQETNHGITVYLPNGNCVSVYNNGKVEFWDEAASNLKEVHQL